MEQATITKSIKLTWVDSASISKIMALDGRITRGPGEVLRLCVEGAALQKPDWNAVLASAITIDYKDGDTSREGDTLNFTVEQAAFISVYESVKEQLGLLRPRASYIARLCLQNACLRLQGVDTSLQKADISQKAEPPAPADPKTFQREMDAFAALSIDEKLNTIYAMLLIRGTPMTYQELYKQAVSKVPSRSAGEFRFADLLDNPPALLGRWFNEDVRAGKIPGVAPPLSPDCRSSLYEKEKPHDEAADS